ncbi:16S rRNA (guanine(527)-N(7))-methyltransferase RsmG [Actinotalea sp. M2MS4P-6]|uniref:16S rRNA (guanine(527)-N(7))-methyltransferase RsmG n=1 Tax=Actinotalea sp. M2MS4P-6 TaxID=2983762 RepID=UPI0021E48CBD|nr:16S rRNA (guanine(527)-N(7))-methyltransferase RsmG [Actinotalea sp. M2MS4P-6]MCV2392846.1 16S rRNA (guanine(527)-N(7))-methyltransferase RsmG [Actinotalea sp. M2MS4P-6]
MADADDASADGIDPLADDPRVQEALGDAYPLLRRFAELLADEGVRRGLIGPREVPRLWERHLLNCAAAASLVPPGRLVDVGSGAGLPGVVLAALRPDVEVVLLEPMERRTRWLTEVVDDLGLGVEVLRGRAEEQQGRLYADAVTARAVAPLERLAGWTLPLLRRGGELLALKGERASDELAEARGAIARLGGGPGDVVTARLVPGVAETWVVRIERVAEAVPELPAPGKRTPSSRTTRSGQQGGETPRHGGRRGPGGGRSARGGRAGGRRST